MRWRTLILGSLAAVVVCVAGCTLDQIFFLLPKKKPILQGPPRLQAIRFVDPIKPLVSDEPIVIHSARNQVVNFAFQLNGFPKELAKKDAIRFAPLQINPKGATIPVSAFTAYQILPMPVDANRAGFIRHTGLSASARRFPRALLPLSIESSAIKLSALRSSDAPTDPNSHPQPGSPAASMLWVDIQVPPTIAAGDYQSTIELFEQDKIVAKLPIRLSVDDFVLPDERHLLLIGAADWPSLQRLFPNAYRGIQPYVLTRRDERYAPAIKVLDDMVKLAQAHRLQLVIPALQPMVKWPFGQPPQIDWGDYDSIVTPWLKGDAFADNVALSYWPLPRVDRLAGQEISAQAEYFQAVAAHFDALDWLTRAPLVMERRSAGRVRLADSIEISRDAAKLLAVHPNIRVQVPLEEEQVQLATPSSAPFIPPSALSRILYMAPGLVSRAPLQQLPQGVGARYLRCEDTAEMPYVGAGADEREVRLWAWLAFLRDAGLVLWPSVLPADNDAAAPADPGQLTWFYPGEWFGVSGLVPTIQLKWLRHAQQDYEYLYLARQRGQLKRATTLARLLAKPIELQATQTPEPSYTLLSGTSQPKAWEQVADLLARTIRLSQPGQGADPAAERQLGYDAAAWSNLQEHPLLIPRTTDWGFGIVDSEGTSWLNLRLGVDVYNAADRQPDNNFIQWAAVPDGWSVRRDARDVPRLGRFSINRVPLEAHIALNRITPNSSRQPLKITFQDGFSAKPYTLEMMAPVARSERLDGPAPRLDGSLGDWSADDALFDGKLVQMLSRPEIQQQNLVFAPTNSTIYSCWTAGNFYVGFKVDGADVAFSNAETSFVRYDFRRAWGEDVCEFLLQPIYSDNSLGPLLHVAVKPRGQIEISRRLNPKLTANPWQAFAASDIRYGVNIDKSIWRGEIGIPWEALKAPNESDKKVVLLRFNFIQHYGTTAQSASWAGPIDYGRDDALTGVLELHQSR